MEHPGFFERAAPIALGVLAEKLGAQLGAGADATALIHTVKPLAEAAPGELAFFENRKYLDQLQRTRASACLVAPLVASTPVSLRVRLGRTPAKWASPWSRAWRARLGSSRSGASSEKE